MLIKNSLTNNNPVQFHHAVHLQTAVLWLLEFTMEPDFLLSTALLLSYNSWHGMTMTCRVITCDIVWRVVTSCDMLWDRMWYCVTCYDHLMCCDIIWHVLMSCVMLWGHVILCDMLWHRVSCVDIVWFFMTLCELRNVLTSYGMLCDTCDMLVAAVGKLFYAYRGCHHDSKDFGRVLNGVELNMGALASKERCGAECYRQS